MNRFKESGTMDRKPGSDLSKNFDYSRNEEIVDQLICSQEDSPGTHKSSRENEKMTGIKRISVRRMVKRNGWKEYLRPQGSRPRELRTEVAGEVQEIRKAFKQFVPHLQALHDKEGHCIKMLFR